MGRDWFRKALLRSAAASSANGAVQVNVPAGDAHEHSRSVDNAASTRQKVAAAQAGRMQSSNSDDDVALGSDPIESENAPLCGSAWCCRSNRSSDVSNAKL